MSRPTDTEGVPRPGVVRDRADLERLDGMQIETTGRYASIPRPRPGPPDPDAPRDHAVLVLEDGTWLFLEPLGRPDAVRTAEERGALEGARVRATGTARRQMPSAGATLIAPCLENVTSVVALDRDAELLPKTHPESAR